MVIIYILIYLIFRIKFTKTNILSFKLKTTFIHYYISESYGVMDKEVFFNLVKFSPSTKSL